MQQAPEAPKVPLEESVAGEEDPGASLDIPAKPADNAGRTPAPPPPEPIPRHP
ncbi:hypothetical protein [Caenimonas aquaedulcis]|uniref:Uncharacterized protein n=1 Tax=Caenimonas aquaedulcis TaxID=2793270 RepID=A0A931H116_9BURK|nr:hypothetical protein [Caenimonas aquaedulcis]MBG9386592.1 hypothetical protein [Caenimonas aquaedulcis]